MVTRTPTSSAMSCEIVWGWFSFRVLPSDVIQAASSADQTWRKWWWWGGEVEVKKMGEREEQREEVKEEVLRHCAGSRRSADAADSLAAVVSPPCRQLRSGLTQAERVEELRLQSLRACVLIWQHGHGQVCGPDLEEAGYCLYLLLSPHCRCFNWFGSDECEALLGSEHLEVSHVHLWLCCHDGVKFWLQAWRDLQDLWTVVWWRGRAILSGGLMIVSSAGDMLMSWKWVRQQLCSQVEDNGRGLSIFSTWSHFGKSFMTTNELKALFREAFRAFIRLQVCVYACEWSDMMNR